MYTDLFVIKASGVKSRFSEKKLRTSLQRAGASEEQIEFITKEVGKQIFEGISTKAIYKLAFTLLREGSRHLAARYHLKQAIMELGPSGYPFEKYIAEILNYQGYQTKVGEIVQGQCVTHEIDVIAEKDDHCYMIECKYHNLQGIFCDVKIPLYIQSRFKDVEAQWIKMSGHITKFYQGWVFTNTKFSTDAIEYGKCVGLNLIGWDYPLKGSLREQIDTLGLYPITCLTSLTKAEKGRLLEKKIVLCKEIFNNKKILEACDVKQSRIYTVMKEAEQLCTHLLKGTKAEEV
ncbi:MAG: ATP cone domain-containing protein [Bacteroidota bacterium]|nr:ATP cone domain-containing protein [Bacteroidota bacterium]